MPPTDVLILTMVILLSGLLVFGVVRWIVWSTIGEIQREYAAKEPSQNAVSRPFQSFSFDILNLGWCVHVDADESYLHLRPAWLARVIGGMRPVSIPWDAIEVKGKATLRYAMLSAKVGKVTMVGPAWCLNLASSEATETGGSSVSAGASGPTRPA